jgi:hypothetical protein
MAKKKTYYVISYFHKYGLREMHPGVTITTMNPIKWLLNARKNQLDHWCITNILTTTDKKLAERCYSEMKGRN